MYGNSPVSAKFCEIIFDLNLCQLVSEPTHIHGNILDLVLTNNPDNIVDLIVHSKSPFSISSDHFVITFRIYSRIVHSTCKVGSRLRNFSRGDFVGLCHYLSNSNFTPCYQTNDIEFVWSFISTTIKNAMDHFIPFTIVHQAHQPKWFNSSIRHRIKCLNTLRRKCNKHPTATIRTKIEESEKSLQAEISKAKIDYEANLVSSCANNSNNKIYQYIKYITKTSSIPQTLFHNSSPISSDLSKADAFNKYFHSVFTQDLRCHCVFNYPSASDSLSEVTILDTDVYNVLANLDTSKATGPDEIPPIVLSTCASALCKPLHYLFCLCLDSGYLPSEWKVHKVIPVFKSGDHSLITNYRPISLLSNISKVLERLIYDKIIDHVTPYIKPIQFGFMSNRSTIQQMLIFLHDIFCSKYQTDTIYLDISKAFDSVSHFHLLDKLTSFNISGRLWLWFRAYLTNRFQFVLVNNQFSQLLPVESGVPQGSILGPLLFIIYINDISDAVLYSKTLLFADDTKCFRLIKSFSDQQLLQQDLNSLSNWSTKSNLSFKPSKTVHVSYNSKISTSYSINDSMINLKSHHKDLGIVVSDDLQWHLHHNHILDKSYKILGMIRRTFGKSNSVITKAKLYTSLIRSQLAYCSIIWRPYLIQDIIKLESIQRRATKFIMNDYTSDYKSRLLHLNLLPLMHVFEITDIIFLVKSFKFPSASFNINNYVSFQLALQLGQVGLN